MQENEYLQRLHEARDSLQSDQQKSVFDQVYFNEMKNPVIQYGYNYFLGYFAVSRFTLGHIGVAVPKLIVGLMGLVGAVIVEMDELLYGEPWLLLFVVSYFAISIWILIDYFLLPAATRRYNAAKLDEVVTAIRENRDLSGT